MPSDRADSETERAIEPLTGRWVLAIETSNPSAASADPGAGTASPTTRTPGTASVAGARTDPDGKLGEIVEIEFPAANRERDGLLPAIDRVRTALNVVPGDLGSVCVSVGPGGYTGLRVSVTVAKSIARATGAELVGVPSATVAVGEDRPDQPFCVCLASKGDRTHVTAFPGPGDGDGEPIGVLDAEGLIGWYDGPGPGSGEILLVADRFLPEPIRAACLQRHGRILAPRFSATRCLHAGYGRSGTDPVVLTPKYAREPEAVRLWRERRAKNA